MADRRNVPSVSAAFIRMLLPGCRRGYMFGAVLISFLGLAVDCRRSDQAKTVPVEHQRGAALARANCGSCHLVPTPDLLPKRAFADVLHVMGLYLGHDDRGYRRILSGPNTKAKRDLNVRVDVSRLPSRPLVTASDWGALRAYYESLAPADPAPLSARQDADPENRVEREDRFPSSGRFRAVFPEYAAPNAVVTAVVIDPKNKRALAVDAADGRLLSLDGAGRLQAKVLLSGLPVALRPSMGGMFVLDAGNLFPTTARIGRLTWLSEGAPLPVLLQGNLYRSAHLAVDGHGGRSGEPKRFLVSGFGHHDGELVLLTRQSGGAFTRRVLERGAGFIRAAFVDFDRDGRMDVLALQAQARERLLLFRNIDGPPATAEVLLAKHPAYGFTSFTIADMNKDGFPDVITTNGDNGDLSTKPLRPYHGVRVYRNRGGRSLELTDFLPLDGAYDTRAADFDGDGDIDIAAIAFYPDFGKLPPRSFVYYENGWRGFVGHSVPEADNGRWLVMDAGDVDGDGDPDLILGGAYNEKLGGYNMQVYQQSAYYALRKPVLILENRGRSR